MKLQNGLYKMSLTKKTAPFIKICVCVYRYVCVWEPKEWKQRNEKEWGIRNERDSRQLNSKLVNVFACLPWVTFSKTIPSYQNQYGGLSLDKYHNPDWFSQRVLHALPPRLSPWGPDPRPASHYHSPGWTSSTHRCSFLKTSLRVFLCLRTTRPSSMPERITPCMRFWVWPLPRAPRWAYEEEKKHTHWYLSVIWTAFLEPCFL